VVGYFAEWGVYGRNYHEEHPHQRLGREADHILYAFGNTTGGRCTIGDSYADYDKAYTAADSVDGVADTWDQPLRGSFNQLRKLKKMYPHLKVIWSFGGWTWSGGFTQATQNPAAFAESCHSLVEDPRWADVFDGIDIDWEYPNACGLQCDASGPNAFKNVVSALRTKFGSSALVTAAITADGSTGGKIDATDYAGAAPYLNWFMPMTYDYFGAFNAQGPTPASRSPRHRIPWGFRTRRSKLGKGVPVSKLLLIGFWRGRTEVTQALRAAAPPARQRHSRRVEDWVSGTARPPARSPAPRTPVQQQLVGYDTPLTIGKMTCEEPGLSGASLELPVTQSSELSTIKADSAEPSADTTTRQRDLAPCKSCGQPQPSWPSARKDRAARGREWPGPSRSARCAPPAPVGAPAVATRATLPPVWEVAAGGRPRHGGPPVRALHRAGVDGEVLAGEASSRKQSVGGGRRRRRRCGGGGPSSRRAGVEGSRGVGPCRS
jgi:hypothetical protein